MGKVVFDRYGESGNIFYVLGMAYSVLLAENRRVDAQKMGNRVWNSESYEDALNIIGEYVELVEADEE